MRPGWNKMPGAACVIEGGVAPTALYIGKALQDT